MAQLTIDGKKARQIYPSAAPELKTILEDTFSKDFFKQDIKDRIKTFDDACEYNNTNPKAKRFTQGTRNQIYQERVAEIVKALNEGWVPNYDNSSELKYTPYFYLDTPGFRFYDSCYAHSYATAGAGSRFAFKSRDLSDYAGNQFVKEYESWMTPLKAGEAFKADTTAASTRAPFAGDMKAWETYIVGRVKTFENACAEVGEDPNDYNFSEGTPDEIAYKKLKVIAKALNNGWEPDWNNGNQAKWYPWFYLDTPGFRFNVSHFTYSAALAGSGSRLRFASEILSNYAGKQYLELYRQYMTL